MTTKPLYTFDDETSVGLDKIPLNAAVMVESYNGTPTYFTFTDRTGVLVGTTVSSFLTDPGFDGQSTPFDVGSQEAIALIEDDIVSLTESLANLSSGQGQISHGTVGAVGLTEAQLDYVIDIDASDPNIFTFDAVANTVTLLKPGNFNFLSNVQLTSATASLVNLTFNLRDISDETIVGTSAIPVNIGNGFSASYSLSTLIVVAPGSEPLTFDINAVADATGITIDGFSSLLSSMAISGGGVSAHSLLTGLSDADGHPISAITGLTAALAGKVDDAQVQTNVPAGALFTDTVFNDANVVRDNIDTTFSNPVRGAVTTEDNIIAFSAGNNFKLTAIAGTIQAGALVGCTGQSGTIVIYSAQNVTGWDAVFNFKTVPTGLTGEETFAYFIEDETTIRIGRLA